MDRSDFSAIASKYLKGAEGNFISAEIAITNEAAGVKIFEDPIFAFGDAEDALFEQLKQPSIIGSHFMTPKWWLPEARTVVSFFLPFSQAVREGNKRDMLMPSAEWLHARIEGQALLLKLCGHLKSELQREGHKCVVPTADPRFWSKTSSFETPFPEELSFTSNWSERHVAYVCGLGTFSLSKGMITSKGIAGRFGSLVSDIVLPFSERAYSNPYEYCTMCGSCATNCPANAITLEGGKDHVKCYDFVETVREKFSPRYGCGKCQVGVPCEFKIPDRKS